MGKTKLLACDMDGTFLRSDRTAHPDNLSAVREAVEQGILFCLASGRGISTIRPFLAELGLKGPVVSSNGAYVVGLQGEVVFDSVLSPDAITEIVAFADRHGIHLNRYHGEEITFSGDGPHAQLYRDRVGCEPPIASMRETMSLPATKLLFVGTPEEIDGYQSLIEPLLPTGLVSVVRSEPEYLEFLPGGVTKGAGLQKLAAHLSIKPEECAAIGDWLNDLEMLEWVGRPACVANAHPEILAVCPEVFPDNDSGGVASFIRTLTGSVEGV